MLRHARGVAGESSDDQAPPPPLRLKLHKIFYLKFFLFFDKFQKNLLKKIFEYPSKISGYGTVAQSLDNTALRYVTVMENSNII